jgi:serine protease Do
MQKRIILVTLVVIAIDLSFAPLGGRAEENAAPSVAPAASVGVQKEAGEQPFDDIVARTEHFASELGRMKEGGQTIPTEQLIEQAGEEKTCRIVLQNGSKKNLTPETLYAQSKASVVAVGGIYKCSKCNQWHARCSGGFVVGKEGLLLTNFHVVAGFKGLEAAGVMTFDGRVFPVKAVLASSPLNDLALLKVDADDLQPLPVAKDISVGASVYCLSHSVISDGKINCFYAFTSGLVVGKFAIHNDKQQLMKVLAVTTDYGPGASGGPILNEHGEVVAVVCQAIPLVKLDHEKEVVPMVWKFARPSCEIWNLLNQPKAERE